MAIHVVQGERDLVADCRSLARFELRGIPPMVAGAARIRVTFQVDADGLLSVSAREASTGVEAAVEVKPSYGLADDQVARMLAESFQSADADMQARALRELQVESEQMIAATEAALAVDAQLLSSTERAVIDGLIERLRRAGAGADRRAIKALLDEVNLATGDFAARRMDQSIRAALAGRKLDEVSL
jgi:molecular chaperone HscA